MFKKLMILNFRLSGRIFIEIGVIKKPILCFYAGSKTGTTK